VETTAKPLPTTAKTRREPPSPRRPAPPSFLALVAPHLPPALEEIKVPAYVIDSTGRIRWINAAAREIVGDCVGRMFTSVIEPSDARRARARFVERLQGIDKQDFAIDLVAPNGEETAVEISSVPLRANHRAIGMFGFAMPRQTTGDRPPKFDARLTPRQHEILTYIADGESTERIATKLHLSRETVRNHVRHILQRLGANSRLEAVAIARRDEIL
jgi:PAS domain S-box-containing protein